MSTIPERSGSEVNSIFWLPCYVCAYRDHPPGNYGVFAAAHTEKAILEFVPDSPTKTPAYIFYMPGEPVELKTHRWDYGKSTWDRLV